MSGSLRGRKSEEMTQLNTSSPQGSEVPFESQRRVMAIKVPQNEEIFGGKNGGRKEIGLAIHQRRTNRGSIHIKK